MCADAPPISGRMTALPGFFVAYHVSAVSRKLNALMTFICGARSTTCFTQSKPEGRTARLVRQAAGVRNSIVGYAKHPRVEDAVICEDSLFSQVRVSVDAFTTLFAVEGPLNGDEPFAIEKQDMIHAG